MPEFLDKSPALPRARPEKSRGLAQGSKATRLSFGPIGGTSLGMSRANGSDARSPVDKPTGDPQWYKDAIFYEVRVSSFFDANGDGIGDFQGLEQKLDYLEDLGVTVLWLLPFYPSPLRDDGYDIADYTDVHPDLGTLEDFRSFLDAAHRRGLRVVTEL